MLDDAGRAAGCEVPIVFFGKDAVEPGESRASFATECTLGLGAFLTGEGTGCCALGLVVD